MDCPARPGLLGRALDRLRNRPDGGARRSLPGCRLRLEPLEDRRMLSVVPAGEPGGGLTDPPCPVAWDTVFHDDNGDLFAIDLTSGAGGCQPVHLGKTRESTSGLIVTFTDMAYSKLENAYYGVTGSSHDTSLLYRVTIDTCVQPPAVTTEFVGYLCADAPCLSPSARPVNLNALEFSNDGTRLFAAGRYNWDDTCHWIFEIDLTSRVATRIVKTRVDSQNYHSAGDIEFDCAGNMYLTTLDGVGTCSGALLKVIDPLSPDPVVERLGHTGYTDIYGLTYDPINGLLAYLSTSHESPPQLHRREIRRLDLNVADGECPAIPTEHFSYLPHAALDDVYGAATTIACADYPAGIVIDYHVFYNNSAFDGHDSRPNAEDDKAIAFDKEPLLPGGVATFDNYTSYSRGINGIMVDVAGLPADYAPDAGHFEFALGNGNDPSSWLPGPDPTTLALRKNAGTDGSDRITIAWEDYAIGKQWLQVTVLEDDLGLAANNVFCFGNAVAEAGNHPGDAQVTVTDLLLARNNPRNFMVPAEVDFPYDYNRDGRVNSTDVLLARNNQTNFRNWLNLINLSGVENAAPDAGTSHERMAWLYELEQTSVSKLPPKRHNPTEKAVDTLLGLYSE